MEASWHHEMVYDFHVIFGPHAEKTCLRVSEKASFKPVSSATETS